jgi:hypothetical protein
MIFRCAAFKRKGAEILTVLLVVVLLVMNISSTYEIVWLQPGDFAFYRASHPDESSLENENGRCYGNFPGQRPFLIGGLFSYKLGL